MFIGVLVKRLPLACNPDDFLKDQFKIAVLWGSANAQTRIYIEELCYTSTDHQHPTDYIIYIY